MLIIFNMNFQKERFNTKENLITETLPNKTNRILELDGLRAFAVLLVVFYHMVAFSKSIPFISPSNTLILVLGRSGVQIFFVISGFIITHLLLKEYEKKEDISLISFYQKRFFRIIPSFFAYLLAILLLTILGLITTQYINFVWSVLFLGNFDLYKNAGLSDRWFFLHTWTLGVEEQYYLIFPPILVWLLKLRKKRIVTVLSIIIFCICLSGYEIAKVASVYISPVWTKISTLSDFRYIIAGVLFALHKEKIEKIVKNTSWVIPLVLIALIITTHYLGEYKFLTILLKALTSFFLVFLIMWFMSNPEKCSILRWKVVQWIGRCSYSIYLWQQLFTGDASCYNTQSIAQYPMLAIIAILSCAAISYYFIEVPCMLLGKKFSQHNVSKLQHIH
jgi:peptidoglycan/LPS O-acetylase OafA/YrhL